MRMRGILNLEIKNILHHFCSIQTQLDKIFLIVTIFHLIFIFLSDRIKFYFKYYSYRDFEHVMKDVGTKKFIM